MNKKMLFIFNPHAGKGSMGSKLLALLNYFTSAGYDVTAYPTQMPEDALKKTKEEAAQYDLLVCSGGDGTLDEVVTGMLQGNVQIPLGYLPAGTTNDFARSLKISRTAMKAAQTVIEGVPFACDMGSFNKDYFVYIAAFGAFTEVSYQTNQQVKNVLGHLAYVLEGVKRLPTLKSYEVEVEGDGKLHRGLFIYGMVTNSISVGGYKNLMGKDVKMNDGLFEVTLIYAPANILELQEIITGLLSGNLKGRNFLSFKAARVKLYSENLIPWTLDGEFGGEHCEVEIENHQKAISIMVDEPKEKRGQKERKGEKG